MRAVATQCREDPRFGDVVLEENVSDKTQYTTDAPAGAALISQAMDRREGAGRYRAMQSIMDWDRSRLAYRTVKRAFDIVFSGAVLLVIAIPSLVLAAAIRMESEGSPFYSQIRVGQTRPDGSLSTFRMWKFRSMYKDAEERKKELESQNEMNGFMFKMKDDPRITKVGKFIRKTSIDELPQFYNVLKGDMSLVGTRPPTVDEFRQYESHQKRRLSAKPGITGLWQVSGRNEIKDFEDVVKLHVQYIDNWSIGLDIKIILKTIKVVFEKGGE